MRVAWFRPDTASDSVIAGLRESHDVRIVDAAAAHDFVWQAAQGSFDLCVYELDDTAAHQYIWPYLLHYPGVVVLRTSSLHHGRALSLVHQCRDADRDAEMAFADGAGRTDAPWPLLRGSWSTWRVPVLASRLTVVADHALASDIRETCPSANVVVIPPGISDPKAGPAPSVNRSTMSVWTSLGVSKRTFSAALLRARAASSAPIKSIDDGPAAADVVIATQWPTLGRPLTGALSGFAAGRAVIVADTASTAHWPTVDPQTWQPRSVSIGLGNAEAPIAISIDPRDEEHSLMLAFVRLANDAALRAALGGAARAWWGQHATVAHAVNRWLAALDAARALPAPPRPAGWPAHLDADASGTMTAVLEQFGQADLKVRLYDPVGPPEGGP
jgi:hypothetical protein